MSFLSSHSNSKGGTRLSGTTGVERQMPCPTLFLAYPAASWVPPIVFLPTPAPLHRSPGWFSSSFTSLDPAPILGALALKATLGILSKGLLDSSESMHSHFWGKLGFRVCSQGIPDQEQLGSALFTAYHLCLCAPPPSSSPVPQRSQVRYI